MPATKKSRKKTTKVAFLVISVTRYFLP